MPNSYIIIMISEFRILVRARQGISSGCTEDIFSVHTEDISSVCTEDISSVYTEVISSVYAEDISSVCTEDASSVYTEDISSACTEEHLLCAPFPGIFGIELPWMSLILGPFMNSLLFRMDAVF